jgi:prolipoprotein diacylglyceryltransferase
MKQEFLFGHFSIFSIITSGVAALGLALSVWRAAEKKTLTVYAGAAVLAGSLAGGRLGYVLLNWSYFQENAFLIPQVWHGGLTWPGALLGGVIAAGLAAWINREKIGQLADRLLPLLGMVCLGAWTACWLDGCAYGPETQAWWGLPVVNEFGEQTTRLPVPLIVAVLDSAVAAAAIFLPARKWLSAPGRRAALGLSGVSLVHFTLSLLRTDPTPTLWVFRWESWFALAFTLAAVGTMLFLVHPPVVTLVKNGEE